MIWTADLWCRKRPLCQLRHNHDPKIENVCNADSDCKYVGHYFGDLALYWRPNKEKMFKIALSPRCRIAQVTPCLKNKRSDNISTRDSSPRFDSRQRHSRLSDFWRIEHSVKRILLISYGLDMTFSCAVKMQNESNIYDIAIWFPQF